jgi:catalase
MEQNIVRDKASHQIIEHGAKHQEQVGWITTSTGHRIDSLTSSLTVGKRGPILLQDTVLLNELSHFDHERIPERVVFASGAGAFGHFETTNDVTRYTRLPVFELVGKRTHVVVRFSSGMCGEKGSADTLRDSRGMSVKFYTGEGVWDLVCSNMPAFAVRDPLLVKS